MPKGYVYADFEITDEEVWAEYVTTDGVFVGRLYIGAVIKHSAFHTAQEKAKAAGNAVLDLPLVDPGYLADVVWSMQNVQKEHEIIYTGREGD